MGLVTQRISQSNAIQAKTLADAKAQQASRDALTANMEEDLAALETDLATIKNLLQEKTDVNESRKQKVALLESKITDLYSQLRNLSISLSRRAFGRP